MGSHERTNTPIVFFFLSFLLSSLELSDTQVYELEIRALLGTDSQPIGLSLGTEGVHMRGVEAWCEEVPRMWERAPHCSPVNYPPSGDGIKFDSEEFLDRS